MNDKYERTETYHERYEHDMREFKKRIDQLEEENAKLKAKLDEIEQYVSVRSDGCASEVLKIIRGDEL